MHIRLELPRARLRRWHVWLIEYLTDSAANSVSVMFTDSEPPPALALSLLLNLETLTRSGAAETGSAAVTPDELLSACDDTSDGQPHVVVSLGGTGGASVGAVRLTLVFDDQPHEDALWLALLARRAPILSLRASTDDDQNPSILQTKARPGLEVPHILSQSADAVFSRAIELIGACVAIHAGDKTNTRCPATGHAPSAASDLTQTAPAHGFFHSTAQFLARRVGDKARSALNHVTKTAPQWSVAWRPHSMVVPNATTTLNVHDFHGLPDDGTRYYADPFCLDKDGLTHVFVEEFPYATERGLISTFTIDEKGYSTTPRPVLETDVHLSYPQVFEHAGDIFMLPEASASGGLDLYRADVFPHAWVHDTRLIDEPLHDATLHFDGARWWLFAATQFLRSSSWCALKVFTALTLRGPWHPISEPPIKVDARSARPAGALVSTGDTLWRPAQNCTTGYGHGLTWCRIETLTPDRYVEHSVGSMQFAPANACLGPHTWTATETIETIDLFAAPSARPEVRPKATLGA